ncbi:MAG: glycosyltransferase [Pseudomonadota bacterium]
MKICFVGHSFHNRTKSSDFFQDVLGELGEVSVMTSSPDQSGGYADDAIVEAFVSGNFDQWVFWQTEYVAERLLPLGLRNAILAPMFDGAWSRPDAFFQKFVTCRFLSFSRELHTRLQHLDCRSTFFEYWPKLAPPRERSYSRADWSAFFWERRPLDVPNARSVSHQCRVLGIGKLAIHAVPDFESDTRGTQGYRARKRLNGVELTTSDWFDTGEQYREASAAPLFYFAPRRLEGIGMASLEAMANGQIVIAPDQPTANQYIGHLSSGILYDPDRPYRLPHLSEGQAADLSAAARMRVEFGHKEWEADKERLRSFLLDDGRRWTNTDYSAHFGNHIRRQLHQHKV